MVLLRRSALDVGGSPVGCWAAAQLVPLSECFIFYGAGIFWRGMGMLCWLWVMQHRPGRTPQVLP